MLNGPGSIVHAIKAFEYTTGMSVTVHDISGRLKRYLDPGRTSHATACCVAAKAEYGVAPCTRFDQEQVRETLGKRRSGFAKQCHAGLIEWVAPLMDEDDLIAVLFAGQRRAGGQLQPLLINPALKRHSRNASSNKLPSICSSKSLMILELLEQLAARLSQCLMHIEQRLRPIVNLSKGDPAHGSPDDRLALIHRYIYDFHTGEASLGGLADRLSLSPTRVGHLVVELTGRSFKQLVMQARLGTAEALLQHTDLPIDEVGRRSGLPNASHFHRVFKKAHGQTPHQFRKSAV
jgi:AraC-like DNA-binding protein